MLKIKKEVVEQIKKQGEEGYPYEICGFLIGSIDYSNNTRTVLEAYQVENRNKERANDRFEIHPKDYLKVEDYAEKKGLMIVGIYHTHPDHPDRPSQTDLRFAQPDMSYIILSVKDGKADKWRSWELVGDRFEEEGVELI
ncbi:Proteasome lid subunit RPN8/RPN11, contains Jab1/MPN metalloenzyme (JAMM) motif [Persephonella hydrogeniphila]|uniref:Proteasome lid subunit RPN8/RPN11, contains Jab1/MPN metalloenzyme (JAMM) motif n=1 Tax=Persephonella hydrogeniphila TaxID=198703 RepID=A0A285NJ55_9AQUI|nr:M67 family metallopeptidase [Persephonella hydrogeniphila]SNZ08953.1 Proteasome lid subunit RPN8/RPN11, contains Jab1/MPN metalloenzyme (JAMM) motif [Persephonella hydrogeniphila]